MTNVDPLAPCEFCGYHKDTPNHEFGCTKTDCGHQCTWPRRCGCRRGQGWHCWYCWYYKGSQ